MAKRQSGFVRSGTKTGYEKVPDSFMGYAKDQARQKGYAEGRGKSFRVLVEHEGAKAFKDEIKGRSAAHALERAHRNWPGAKVRVTNLVRGAAGQLLSPAGLAEGFASKAAADQQKRKFMEQNRRENDKKAAVRRGKTTA